MENRASNFDANYYASHCGPNYERGQGWEEFFGRISDRIVKEINPKSVLDVGCAKGFLVEALRDRGEEAYGIDISEYAISQVRDDIKPYCKVGSATEPFNRKYDLITNIEVLEHMDMPDIKLAIENFCNHTDDIIFSSSPFDYAEESHINVRPISFWVEQFAYNNFIHEVDYDVSYLAIQSMRFRRRDMDIYQAIRMYEEALFCKIQENISLRSQNDIANARIKVLDENNIKTGQIVDETKVLKDKLKVLEDKLKVLKDKLEKSEIARESSRKDMAEARRLVKDYEEKYYVEQENRKFLESELFKYRTAADERLNIINAIHNSRTWKLGKPVRFMGRVARKIKRLFVRNK